MLFHKGLESMDLPSIVIDSGTSMIRAGFAGNDTPTEFFPNVFGEVKSKIPTYISHQFFFSKIEKESKKKLHRKSCPG